MLLILWSACWLMCGASLAVDFIRPGFFKRDPRQARYVRLSELSLMVVATGGIFSYFLNSYAGPGGHVLRIVAVAIQATGYVGVVCFALRRLAATRRA
jgi:hypothetical protein